MPQTARSSSGGPASRPARPANADGTESRRQPSLVPQASLAGNALIIIIAIMSFLASLTAGGVSVVREAAATWQSQVLREVTIQIIPQDGRDMNEAIRRSLEIARATPGVASAIPYTDTDLKRLLEPWLGKNIALEELPTPRLIVVRTEPGATPDFDALASRIQRDIPGASLDDHRAWLDQLRVTGDALSGFGLTVLGLVLLATTLSVLFATRSAVAGNRDVVEVLHVVGARDGYIARAFGRRFFNLGLRGGLSGGAVAMVLFALADWKSGSADDGTSDVLLGQFNVTSSAYLGILAVALAIAVLTTVTSRLTVMAHLRRLD